MRWYRVDDAARELLGGSVSAKTLYSAIRRGELQAARIGAGGRNLLLCEEHIDAWLRSSTSRPRPPAPPRRPRKAAEGTQRPPAGGSA